MVQHKDFDFERHIWCCLIGTPEGVIDGFAMLTIKENDWLEERFYQEENVEGYRKLVREFKEKFDRPDPVMVFLDKEYRVITWCDITRE